MSVLVLIVSCEDFLIHCFSSQLTAKAPHGPPVSLYSVCVCVRMCVYLCVCGGQRTDSFAPPVGLGNQLLFPVYVSFYVRMYVCMYVCMCVCLFVCFLCVWVFCVNISMLCMHAWCLQRPEEGVGSPGTVVTDDCEPLCWYWELNTRLLTA